MKILAVDTSSNVATVAIMEDDILLGQYSINHKKTHSQKLMPMISSLLEALELKPADIDFFAASSGPGSFTGLRIGVTTIKAMAFAVNKPVVSVPTLDALAYNVPETEYMICPMLDARNQQVFTALYCFEQDKLVRISDYMGIHIEELLSIVQQKSRKTVFLGDGASLHSEYLTNILGDKFALAPGNVRLQCASSVAKVAEHMVREGKTESCYDMVPFYLRKSQAERMQEISEV